eukprot:1884610-Pleurochrysis_carterae.AAC.1
MRCAIRDANANENCAVHSEQNHLNGPGGVNCAIQIDLNHHKKPEQNNLNATCEIYCAIGITHRQRTLRKKGHMERKIGTRRHAAKLSVKAWIGICGSVIIWLTRVGKEREGPEHEEHKKNKGGEKASSRATRKNQQRRLIQQRIKRWNKT